MIATLCGGVLGQSVLARCGRGVLAVVMVLGMVAGTPLLVQPVSAAPTAVSAANTQLTWEATSPQGATVTLDGTASSADAVSFQWWEACTTTPPCAGGTLLGTGAVLQVTLGIGLHPITLWAADAGGALGSSALISVNVVATEPIAEAGPNSSYVATSPQGANVNLNGTGSTNAATYSWSLGGVEIANGPAVSAQLPIGTSDIVLTVVSSAGVTDTDSVSITVTAVLPNADAGADQTVASANGGPTAVTLNGAASTNAATFSWDLPGSLPNAVGVNPTVSLPVGVHTIILTATSVSGNTDSDSVTVTVTGPPPPLNADAGPDRTVYLNNGTTATVTLDGTGSTGAVSYSWRVAGSAAAPVTRPDPTFLLREGIHTIQLTVTGVDGSKDTDEIVITALPEPPLSADAGPDQTVVATNGTTAQVQLDGSGSNGAISYAWNLPGALPDATGVKPVVTLPIGTYSITLTTTNASGNTRIDTVVIAVQKPAASASISTNQGPIGTVINYSFIGFPSNTQVNIFFVGGGSSMLATQINANASGVGSGSLVVPTMVGGPKDVRFVVAGTIYALAGFTVTPRFTLTPATVERGDGVLMSVTGFLANEPIKVRWRINGEFVQVASGSTNASGIASGTISVPAGATLGVNTVRVDGTTSSAQTSGISIVAPAAPVAILTPSRGIVGAEIAYQVSNFPPLAVVNIALNKPTGGSVVLGSVTADSSGSGTGTFVIPASPGGANQTVRFSSGELVADAPLEIAARIKVDPGNAGGTAPVSLRGFGKGEVVNIRWLVGGTYQTVATVTTSNTGSANLDVPIPVNAAVGPNTVRAEGQTFSAQTNAAEVSPAIPVDPDPAVAVSPNRAIPNSTIAYTVSNYPANAPVDLTLVRLDGTQATLGSVQTDANGAASGTFVVPATPGGAGQKIRFTSGLVITDAAFEVVPRILVTAGTAGQPTAVSLRGFGKSESVNIRWLVNGTYRTIGTVTTSSTGSANLNVTIPLDAAGGNNTVRAEGTTASAQTNSVAVTPAPVVETPTAMISPNRAVVGTAISYSLANFPADAQVAITLVRSGATPVSLGTVATDVEGEATGTVLLPAAPGGANQLIRFTAGSVTVDATIEIAPRVTVAAGTAGSATTVTLSGFSANEQVRLRWLVGSSYVDVGTVATSATGSASTSVTIPASAAAGNNTVRAEGTIFRAQTNLATVTTPEPEPGPTATVTPGRAVVGGMVSYSVSGFPAETSVAIALQKGTAQVGLGVATTTADGRATGTVMIPTTTGGAQIIRFSAGDVVIDVPFEVAPRITVGSGLPGDTVTVTLRGYAAGEVVNIRWLVDSQFVTVGQVTTAASGSATTTVAIPANATPGTNSVRGDGPITRAQTNAALVLEPPVVIVATASISPSRAVVGTAISYTLEDFSPDVSVTISLQRPGIDPLPLGTAATSGDGDAIGTVTLSETPGGMGQSVRFSDGVNTVDVPLEVAPRIFVEDGIAGSETLVYLTGFGANENVVIRWRINGAYVTVGTLRTLPNGSGTAAIDIPDGAPTGNNVVRAEGSQFRAQTNFAMVIVPVSLEQ